MANADRKALEALLTRIEAATEPDREIDANLMTLLVGGQIKRDNERNWRWGYRTTHEWKPLPKLTASIDAALALVERITPDQNPIDVLEVALVWLRETRGWRPENIGAQIARAVIWTVVSNLLAQTEAAEHE